MKNQPAASGLIVPVVLCMCVSLSTVWHVHSCHTFTVKALRLPQPLEKQANQQCLILE